EPKDIANPIDGMILFNPSIPCVMIYSSGWNCVSSQEMNITYDCNTINFQENIFNGGSNVNPTFSIDAISLTPTIFIPESNIINPISGITGINSSVILLNEGLNTLTFSIDGIATEGGVLQGTIESPNTNSCTFSLGVAQNDELAFNYLLENVNNIGESIDGKNDWVIENGTAVRATDNNSGGNSIVILSSGGVLSQTIELPANSVYEILGIVRDVNTGPFQLNVKVEDTSDNSVLVDNNYSGTTTTYKWLDFNTKSTKFSTNEFESRTYKVTLAAIKSDGTNSSDNIRITGGKSRGSGLGNGSGAVSFVSTID
ncbi:MAG: hypothetical protein ACK5HU_04555, partial [Flavobacteriales bacterium]